MSESNRAQVNRHPATAILYGAMRGLEQFPASQGQTDLSLLLGRVREAIHDALDETDTLRAEVGRLRQCGGAACFCTEAQARVESLTAQLAAERERVESGVMEIVAAHIKRGEPVEYQREGAFGGRAVTVSRRGDLCDVWDELRRYFRALPAPEAT